MITPILTLSYPLGMILVHTRGFDEISVLKMNWTLNSFPFTSSDDSTNLMKWSSYDSTVFSGPRQSNDTPMDSSFDIPPRMVYENSTL